MKATSSIALVLASLTLVACDNVKFPGASPRPSDVEQQSTPPPPTVPASEESTSETTPTAPSPVSPTPEDTGETPTDIPADTTTSETEESAPVPGVDPYQGVDNLLSINAVRCGVDTRESLPTIAQIASATRPASATVSAQAVNGTQSTTADFPGIVKMEPKRRLESGGISSGHCGATRIAKNWFITASHCLDESYDEIDLISTEASLLDPRAVRIQASGTLCHAAYGGAAGQYSNDVALVSISDEGAEAFKDVPIARFGATDKSLGTVNYPRARMAGWGITSFDGGELSNDLLTTTLTLVSSGPAAITVASLDDAGPCIGDSGGPLLIDEEDGLSKVIGVLSIVEQNRLTGEFCKGNYNARYTNLEGFVDWIDDVIGVCTSKPDLCAR